MTHQPCTHVAAERRPAAPVGRLSLIFGLTALFMVVEAVGGWLSGSLALLADAGHMLTDVGALGLTLLTAWIARRPADGTKTYGYLRWEILAALINGAVLLGLSAWVVVEAISRFRQPAEIRGGLFLAVAVAGLVVNGISIALLHGSHAGHLNTRGAYLHILSDLLGSVGAVIAAVLVLTTGWTLADPIVSVALALLILRGAWRLVRESTDVLLEAVPAHISMGEVEQRIRSVPGVAAVHDLHVWTVTSGVVAMSGHAVVPELGHHAGVLEAIRGAMGALGIGHVTIQLEADDACAEGVAPPVAHAHQGHHGHAH